MDSLYQRPEGLGQSETVKVRFRPQVWINDYAVDVDPKGPTEWFVAVEQEDAVVLTASLGNDLDWLKQDYYAPPWVVDYDGPYEIELVEGGQ